MIRQKKKPEIISRLWIDLANVRSCRGIKLEARAAGTLSSDDPTGFDIWKRQREIGVREEGSRVRAESDAPPDMHRPDPFL